MEGHGKEREYVAVSLLQAGDVSCWWRVALLFPFSSVLWLDTSGASVLLYSGRPPAHAPWSKPTFYKIISHVYTHKRTHPYMGKHVTHHLAACRAAGCVIRGYRQQQQQAVGGWVPSQMWLPQGLDRVYNSSYKSNASTSKTCYHPLEM